MELLFKDAHHIQVAIGPGVSDGGVQGDGLPGGIDDLVKFQVSGQLLKGLVRPNLFRQAQPHVGHVHGGDVLHAVKGLGRQDGQQADGAHADEGHPVLRLELGPVTDVQGHRQGLGQGDLLLVGLGRDLDQGLLVHGDVLGKAALADLADKAQALAGVIAARLAAGAMHTGHHGVGDDHVAGGKALHLVPHLTDHAHKLVAHGLRDVLDEHPLVIDVQVRAADPRVGHLDQRVGGAAGGLFHRLEPHVLNSVVSGSFHVVPPFPSGAAGLSWPATLRLL